MRKSRKRLDAVLYDRGFFASADDAARNVMAGSVFVNGVRVDKPGQIIYESSDLTVKGNPIPYVSRGGLKLEKAIGEFGIDVGGKTALDVGASTGGFTDCFLKNGASRVIAIDVGYGQFAWKLRTDPRVSLFERTNIRYLKPSDIGVSCGISGIDVSFISLRLVLPVVKALLNKDGEAVCLIKPQFEAERDQVGQKGVVSDPEVHREVIAKVIAFSAEMGYAVAGLSYSPIKGPEGNLEYLLYLKNDPEADSIRDMDKAIDDTVRASHLL